MNDETVRLRLEVTELRAEVDGLRKELDYTKETVAGLISEQQEHTELHDHYIDRIINIVMLVVGGLALFTGIIQIVIAMR